MMARSDCYDWRGDVRELRSHVIRIPCIILSADIGIEMSHRTQPLQPLSGLPHIIREMRYHEASRQSIGLLLCVFFVVIAQPIPWGLYVSTVIVVIGVGIRLWASGFIVKNEELATTGPYALVRHPLYIGNILIIFAFAGASGLWWTFLIATLFFLFYYPPAIEYEDRKLCAIFGDPWREFAKHTPALLPTLNSRWRNVGGRWSIKTSQSRNFEVVIAVFLLGCFLYNYSRL